MANEYGEIEQLVNDVTSLDTARMTLRWALERLNSIEKEKADLKKNLTLAEETSKRLQVKEASLTDAYSSRSKTLEEKEDFYAKLEATMSLLGEGKLDIRQLLKKEAKLDSLRHSLESEYSDKFEELDRNQRSVIERWNSRLLEVESQYAGRLAEAQRKYDGLRSELEGDYQGRMTALQASFNSREKYLSERIGGLEGSVHLSEQKVEARRRELESEYLLKKREAEENYRKLENMLEAGLEEKIRAMDCDHAEQVRSFEASWQAERARLLEEQRVREDQFLAAQARIKEIENNLAAQQESHHSELLNIISEKEAAFRDQLVKLEAEKTAKEATVRELQARLEKKAAGWDADRSRMQAEFDGRLGTLEAGVREHALELERDYSGRKQEVERIIAIRREDFRKEFDARLLAERQNMAAEKARLEEEKREREAALVLNAAKLKELENALSATREEHHRELLERISAGEASFRDKLAGFESEKRAFSETINNLTDEIRRRDAAILEEKGKIAAEYDAKAAIYEERLANTEKMFEEKRLTYEGKLSALSADLEESVRASVLEKENFNNRVAAISEETRALAEERVAGIRADYEARKEELEREFSARYGDRLKSLEVEKARVNEALAEREGQLEASYAKATELDGAVAGLRRASSEEKAAIYTNHTAEMKCALEAAELAAKELLLESSARERAEAVQAEAAAKMEFERSNWQAERAHFERALAETSGQFHSSQKEIEELNAGLHIAARKNAAAEAAFNREMTEARSGYDKALSAALAENENFKNALKAEAAEQRRETEERAHAAELNAKKTLEQDLELQKARKLDFAEAVSGALASAMEAEKSAWLAEKERLEISVADLAQRFSSAQKDLSALSADNRKMGEKLIESEGRLNSELVAIEAAVEKGAEERLQSAVEVRTAALQNALSEAAARAAAAERERLAAAQAAGEETAYLKETVSGLKNELGEAYVRMNSLDEEFVIKRKGYQAGLIRVQQENAAEFEIKMKAAVEGAVYSVTSELSAAKEEIAKLRNALNEEKRNLRMSEEAAEMSVKQAGEKISALETEKARQKVEAVKELIDKMSEMEEERHRFMQEMQDKCSEKEIGYAARLDEDRRRYEARITELEQIVDEKMRGMEDEKTLAINKLSALGRLEAGVAMKEAQLADDKIKYERETEEKRQELERAYNKKFAEVEKLKTELARTITEYKRVRKAD